VALRQQSSDPFVDLPAAVKPERRRKVRYACNEALCHLGRALPRGCHWGWLVDFSASGAGLLLTEEVRPGTRLALELAPAVGVLQARVVHSCELGGGAWLVGCRFDHPLADDDLRALARP
jgi:hypothetical protein